MKFKKPIVVLVALLMLLASTPATATDNEHSTIITANCLIPDVTIQVVVPTESKVYVNPQSLPVKIDGTVEESQIVCQPARIQNQTEVPLAVSVTVTGAVKADSNMFLSSTSTKGQSLTSKKAFIYFEMKAADSSDTDVQWDAAYNAENHIVVRTAAKSKKNFLTLGAKDKAGCYGVFRLAGDCVERPTAGWTMTDGVDVNVSFTFKPVPNE